MSPMSESTTQSAIRACLCGKSLAAWLDPDDGFLQRFEISTCDGTPTGLTSHPEAVPDVIVTDLEHALGQDGTGLLEEVHRRYYRLPVVVLVDGADADVIAECVKRGAYHVLDAKNAGERLPDVLERAAVEHRLLVQIDQLQDAYRRRGRFGDRLVGVSATMHNIYEIIARVAKTDASVFLTGESGTGKELVAHTLHDLSPRAGVGHIVCLNCATIPKDLLESELFGHEKGAFTGADSRHVGRCEQAHMGTLFLDEISDMDMPLQAKLLRFLEERTFARLGGSDVISVDTRVIAAANRDPEEEIKKGRLREDLYYRLNVVPIVLPPLRARPEDIPVLAQHFLAFYGEKHDKYFWDFSPEAMRMMLCYRWPGNVRELRNTIERIVVLSTSDTVTPDVLPEHVQEAGKDGQVPPLSVEEALKCVRTALREPPTDVEEHIAPMRKEVLPLEEVEKRAIAEAVRAFGGNLSKAARKLGLSRATLYRKIEKYGIK